LWVNAGSSCQESVIDAVTPEVEMIWADAVAARPAMAARATIERVFITLLLTN
jgi:hypothetical protein